MGKYSWCVLCMALAVAGCSRNSDHESASDDVEAADATAAIEADSLGEPAPMPVGDECGSPAAVSGDECGSPELLDQDVAAHADAIEETPPQVFVPPLTISALTQTQAQTAAATETEPAASGEVEESVEDIEAPAIETEADAVEIESDETATAENQVADAAPMLPAIPEHTAPNVSLIPETPAAGDDGFTSLIADDASLTGWEVVEGKIEAWQIDGGVLRCIGAGGGWLQTADAYSDFVFRAEYRLSPGANTGIAVRFPGEGNPSVSGIEIQLLDETAEKYGDVLDIQRTGSLYYLTAANAPAIPHPVGEWNAIEITCQGRRIQVRINDLLVNDVVIDSLDGSAAGQRLAGRAPLGHIALQSYDTAVEFRRLQVRDLARETESGLKIVDLAPGSGDVAVGGNAVTVHYVGQLVTGMVFDDSYQRGQPVTVPIDRVILGWREGIRGMQVGGKRRLIVPPQLAYGEAGVGDVIPPDATLVFDVELIAVAPIIADTESSESDANQPETSEVTENPVEDEQDDTNTETQDTSSAPATTPISNRLTIPPVRDASQPRQMNDPLGGPALFEDEAADPQLLNSNEPAVLPTIPANEPKPLPTTNPAAPFAPASSTQLGPAQPLNGPTLGGPRL